MSDVVKRTSLAAVRVHVVPAVLASRPSSNRTRLSPRRICAFVGAGAKRRSPVASTVEGLHSFLRSNRPRRARESAQGSQKTAARWRVMTAVTTAGWGHPPFIHEPDITTPFDTRPPLSVRDNTGLHAREGDGHNSPTRIYFPVGVCRANHSASMERRYARPTGLSIVKHVAKIHVL